MKDEIDGIVKGAVVAGCRPVGAVVCANVLKDPQHQIKNLTRTPADNEGDDQ